MRVAAASLVFLMACGGARNGLMNDGMGGGGNQLAEGCDRDRIGPACTGLGYDDIGLAVSGAALLTLLVIAKLRR